MEPVGERLRQAREAKGIPLGDIAAITKISVAALTALERGDVSRLPGGIFGRSFVRAYALQVDLDPDQIVKDFAAEVAEAQRDSDRKLRQSVVTPDDREFAARQQRAMQLLQRGLIAAAVIVVIVLSWWFWGRGGTEADTGPAPLAVERSGPPPATPQSSVELPPAPVPPTSAPPARAAGLRVTFSVSAACWLHVTADGLVVHDQTLSAGDRREFTAQRELVLDVGNAGAVTWTINGRPARAIGGTGVHRVVRVNLDNYEEYIGGYEGREDVSRP